MGILFPLVIPTVCHLTDDSDIQVQAAAAILSSCIFGNCKFKIICTNNCDYFLFSP